MTENPPRTPNVKISFRSVVGYIAGGIRYPLTSEGSVGSPTWPGLRTGKRDFAVVSSRCMLNGVLVASRYRTNGFVQKLLVPLRSRSSPPPQRVVWVGTAVPLPLFLFPRLARSARVAHTYTSHSLRINHSISISRHDQLVHIGFILKWNLTNRSMAWCGSRYSRYAPQGRAHASEIRAGFQVQHEEDM